MAMEDYNGDVNSNHSSITTTTTTTTTTTDDTASFTAVETVTTAVDTAAQSKTQNKQKEEAYNEILRKLKELKCPETLVLDFDQHLWSHFLRLPTRYAKDVNVERAEDVLMHKRLLELARDDPFSRPAFHVRLVQVHPISEENTDDKAQESYPLARRSHPPPAFGSSPNLEALALEGHKQHDDDDEGDEANGSSRLFRPMHEITFSTENKPKILSKITSSLADIGLNIQEAHAFCTTDGYSLDVFVVDGWQFEETQNLRFALERELKMIKNASCLSQLSSSPIEGQDQSPIKANGDYVAIPNDGIDDWEIDLRLLECEKKVASGSYGDLYKGTYCNQDVAIKVLKSERLNTDLQKEFAQEVYIMRKLRHKNVVQFIGACTKPSSLCIVTEFMYGGSVYDYLHKHKGTFKLPSVLKIAIDVCKGMNYLHQNNIIHRDLKAANLLMDENEVVKVADFGVARVKAQTGVMTAETGTYRWMAPEVIEHKTYDHKADVFSFAIVLWELLTAKLPYELMTPLQAAVGVVQKGLRPTIPKHCHPQLAELLKRCWQQDPALRPDFSEIIPILQQIAKEVANGEGQKDKQSGGFFSSLRKGHH